MADPKPPEGPPVSDVALSTLRWVHAQDGIDGVISYVDTLIDRQYHDASVGLAWATLLPAVDDLLDACDRHLAGLQPTQRRAANPLAEAVAAVRLPLRHAHQIGDTP